MIVEEGIAIDPSEHPHLTDIVPLRAVDASGRVVAMAVLASWAGRRWGCLEVDRLEPRQGVELALAIRRYLRGTEIELYSGSDAEKHATADRLHEVLGFRRTGESVDGRTVWKWNSKRSPA